MNIAIPEHLFVETIERLEELDPKGTRFLRKCLAAEARPAMSKEQLAAQQRKPGPQVASAPDVRRVSPHSENGKAKANGTVAE